MSLEVACPVGVAAGDTISVEASTSMSFEVVVPDGVHEGDIFYVDPPIDEVTATMDEGSASLFRAVLQALHDNETLDEFVDEHSDKFRDYHPDGEQSLAWGSLHVEYVSIVEHALESVLTNGHGTAEDLYALLDAQQGSARGQRFLDKFLSMGDYHIFCSMMHTWTNLETVKAQSRFIDEEQAAIDEL